MDFRVRVVLFFFGTFIILSNLFGQSDQLKVMYYNVLDFPNSDPGKEVYFRTINQYLSADVILVNELKSATGANLLLNALNSYGISYYQKATYISGDFSENLIYYNSIKLGLVSQDVIYTDLRDINEYVLYYKSADLPVTQDTIYLTFYVAHLKANQGFEQERLYEVNDFLTHLNALPNPENIFFGGDFNLYTSAEPAYQSLVNNGPVNLIDPLPAGDWHNNYTYRFLHTQSTRLDDFGGGSTGGMDDRFDFILFSDDVNSGSNRVSFVNGSCKAFGNDGNHFNGELIDLPLNPDIPDSVTYALYYMSDHLPVVCDIEIEAVPDTTQSNLVITEIMYNPPEIGLDSLEFIEIYNNGDVAENLDGYFFASGINYIFPAMLINPGEFKVISINSSAMQNTFGVNALEWNYDGLNNSGELILLKDNSGKTVDSVYYGDVTPWPSEADGGGPSLILCDPNADNSQGSNWTVSNNFVMYNGDGSSIYASPGSSECGFPPVANFTASPLMVYPGEVVNFSDISLNEPTSWSWIFEGGNPTTSALQNPIVIYDNPGIFQVQLSVSNSYGSDIKLSDDYITVLSDSPVLIISEIMQNPSDVNDSEGEWFEVFNPTNAPVNLSGWVIKDNDFDIHTIASSLIVPPKDFAVLGINANSSTNGGFSCDYQYSNFYLANGADEIVLLAPDDSEIDRIEYDGGPNWPDPNGASMVFTGTQNEDNNNSGNWTIANLREPSFQGTSGDSGSPGTNGNGQNLQSSGFELQLKVFLEGPFNGSSMNTNLNTQIDFPLFQPYSISPWNYPGTESVIAVPNNNIVDWILVELRDATDVSLAGNASVITRKAGFLLSNGDVVDKDGISNLSFDVTVTNQLFLVVYHRNSIPVISSVPLTESGSTYNFDFSVGSNQAYNGGQKEIAPGVWGMISGDCDASGSIDNADKSVLWDNNTGSSGYLKSDLNLNLEVDNNDKNDFWLPNLGESTKVPN